jgi:CheY-like chemotaxis protein
MAGADASDDRLRRRLERAQSAVDAAASLTRRLLSFARRRTRATTSIQPHARIRDLEDLLRHSLGERIDLATHLDPDGWSVDVDAGELDSAIINLVANARDAMPKGGHVTITVENVGLREPETWLAHLAPGAYVRITVVDTGAGMAPEILRRATEPFFTTKPQGAGTGLGLSGIYGFARQSGGGLALESAPGRGTRACLYLPRLTAAAVAARDEALRDGPPRGRGERILVVEDNAELRATLAERLRLLGYEILEAARGRDALAMLANEGAVDLVLSDVVMPGGVDGFDVADWVCANAPRIPVILISGNMAADPRGLTRPGLRIVSKPSPFVDLAQELRAALEA